MTRKNNTPEEIATLVSQIPLGKPAQAGEIAGLVYFLGSEKNSYITGVAIPIDGGFLCQ
jgi:NAD(P)-dependent dehydrogenase (short-subunit alcohol dehydrogenase family)